MAAGQDSPHPSSPLLLEARGVSKSYPGVQALSDVSLALAVGETLAVVGENGAGKSTLMRILGGYEKPDRGDLWLDGQRLRLANIRAAERAGIVLIHQELNLADDLDVAGNIYLGREPTWGGPLRLLRRSIYGDAEQIMRRLGLTCSPRTLVGSLSPGQRQLVEIARALALRSRVLILDEPTSSLTAGESARLFEVLADLRASRVSLIYISHRLREVEQLADRAVVLRDGKWAGVLERHELTADRLIPLMVGRNLVPVRRREPPPPGRPVLRVQGLRWSPKQTTGVSLTLARGEIVGLAGLVGAGRSELAETVMGLRRARAGAVWVEEQPLRLGRPRASLRAGLFLVPEDRRTQGLLLEDTIRRNITLAALGRLSRWGMVRFRAEQQVAQKLSTRLSIRTPSLGKLVGLLSGGNQQKVVMAKGLAREPKVLILDEPTRGVDVGAKDEIYRLLRELADQGLAILAISSDLEEILGLADRLLVMHEGRLAGELGPTEMTEEAVMRLATAAPAR